MAGFIALTLLFALSAGGVASAAAPADFYDFRLEVDLQTPAIYSLDLNYTSKDIIAFDYWYDPVCEYPAAPGAFVSDLDLEYRIPPTPADDIRFYLPSSAWATESSFHDLYPNVDDVRSFDELYFYLSKVTNHDEDAHGYPVSAYLYVRNVHVSGSGGDASGQPIPEPGTLALLGTGLLGFLGFEIRRRMAGR